MSSRNSSTRNTTNDNETDPLNLFDILMEATLQKDRDNNIGNNNNNSLSSHSSRSGASHRLLRVKRYTSDGDEVVTQDTPSSPTIVTTNTGSTHYSSLRSTTGRSVYPYSSLEAEQADSNQSMASQLISQHLHQQQSSPSSVGSNRALRMKRYLHHPSGTSMGSESIDSLAEVDNSTPSTSQRKTLPSLPLVQPTETAAGRAFSADVWMAKIGEAPKEEDQAEKYDDSEEEEEEKEEYKPAPSRRERENASRRQAAALALAALLQKSHLKKKPEEPPQQEENKEEYQPAPTHREQTDAARRQAAALASAALFQKGQLKIKPAAESPSAQAATARGNTNTANNVNKITGNVADNGQTREERLRTMRQESIANRRQKMGNPLQASSSSSAALGAGKTNMNMIPEQSPDNQQTPAERLRVMRQESITNRRMQIGNRTTSSSSAALGASQTSMITTPDQSQDSQQTSGEKLRLMRQESIENRRFQIGNLFRTSSSSGGALGDSQSSLNRTPSQSQDSQETMGERLRLMRQNSITNRRINSLSSTGSNQSNTNTMLDKSQDKQQTPEEKLRLMRQESIRNRREKVGQQLSSSSLGNSQSSMNMSMSPVDNRQPLNPNRPEPTLRRKPTMEVLSEDGEDSEFTLTSHDDSRADLNETTLQTDVGMAQDERPDHQYATEERLRMSRQESIMNRRQKMKSLSQVSSHSIASQLSNPKSSRMRSDQALGESLGSMSRQEILEQLRPEEKLRIMRQESIMNRRQKMGNLSQPSSDALTPQGASRSDLNPASPKSPNDQLSSEERSPSKSGVAEKRRQKMENLAKVSARAMVPIEKQNVGTDVYTGEAIEDSATSTKHESRRPDDSASTINSTTHYDVQPAKVTRTRRLGFLCWLLVVSTGLGIYFGFFYGREKEGNGSTTGDKDEAGSKPAATVIAPPVSAPTLPPLPIASPTSPPSLRPVVVAPTLAPALIVPATNAPVLIGQPSESPIALPSNIDSALFNALLSVWPPLADVISNTSSPQCRALIWLSADEGLSTYSIGRKKQRFALATFFYSTNGQKWRANDGWLSSASECEWYTSDTTSPCDSNNLYASLQLVNNDVRGSIPSELALLSTSLSAMDLVNDGDRNATLSGTLPSELGRLTNLKFLNLRGNKVSIHGWDSRCWLHDCLSFPSRDHSSMDSFQPSLVYCRGCGVSSYKKTNLWV